MDELDPEMIRAAAAGDLAAFEKIVRAYQENIWRFLRRFLGDAAAAEDVAQETFLRLFRSLPGFAHQAKFSAWVFKIARNAALDELRRRSRQAELVGEPEDTAAAGAHEEAAEAALMRTTLRAALAKLSPRERELIATAGLGLPRVPRGGGPGVGE